MNVLTTTTNLNGRALWHGFISLLWVLLLSWAVASPGYAGPPENALDEGLGLIVSSNYKERESGIDLLAESMDPRSTEIIRAMLDGRLYYVKKNKAVVFGEETDSGYAIVSVLTGDFLGTVKKRKLKKIGTNNQIRSKIRLFLTRRDLNHPDPSVRLKAANEMLESLDRETLSVMIERMAVETSEEVRSVLSIADAVAGLKSDVPEERIDSLQRLSGCLNPMVHRKLTQMAGSEKNPAVVKELKKVLSGIDARRSFYAFLETLFFGLSQGSILVLAAIGLAITFGVIGVINMAHGELIMIGAYTTYVVQLLMPDAIGLSLFVAVPAAFVVSGAMGILIERSVIRFLYGRPLETLLATFGISLLLQQSVRTLFSPLNRSVETPAWMSGSIIINDIFSLTMNRVAILIFCLMVFTALFLIMKKTTIGLKVRAVSQNRAMARAMGVRAATIDALTFGLGSGIAGVAGVALSQLTNVGPNLGQAYIIDSFLVVVFGGVGNLWGTFVGGLSLGTVNKFIEPAAGAVLAKIIILVFIILFIQKRPRGLFPMKGRAAVD